MRGFFLMLIAAVIMLVMALPLLIGQTLRHVIMRKPLSDLWWATAIGFDQLGAARFCTVNPIGQSQAELTIYEAKATPMPLGLNGSSMLFLAKTTARTAITTNLE